MIKDLKLASSEVTTIQTQVCVIGAGTAGIFLSQQLRKLGIRVVLLEAGDELARKPVEVDQRCVQRGIRYRGADTGRSFGLGGTSVLWGGQLIPLSPTDLEARPSVDFDAWPIEYSELLPYFSVVKKQLGLGSIGEVDGCQYRPELLSCPITTR